VTRWLEDSCGCCSGYGVVSDYSGGDFNGPTECDACGGQGYYFVSESDRRAMWPGGPFLGREPGRFAYLSGKAGQAA
jgi:hypothetical protein